MSPQPLSRVHPKAGIAIGNAVVVSGIVEEFRPASDPAVPPRTQLINAVVRPVAIGQPLPVPLPLTATDIKPGGALDQLERFEAMRVRVDSYTNTSPCDFPRARSR